LRLRRTLGGIVAWRRSAMCAAWLRRYAKSLPAIAQQRRAFPAARTLPSMSEGSTIFTGGVAVEAMAWRGGG